MAKNIQAIILAGGKGTRLNARKIPKVLYPVNGRPMVSYLVDMLREGGITKPIMVIGFQGQKVVELFGDQVRYVWQRKRLGTGHAVAQAKALLARKPGITVVINGDHPFFKAETLNRMGEIQTKTHATVVIAVYELPDFPYGRVILDDQGFVKRVVEEKNATPAEKKILLKNVGLYLFDNTWLWQAISKLKKDRVSGEYYITDLIELAVKQGKKVATSPITDPIEAIGINTRENLAAAEAAQTNF
jgi:bifunctional UDP-N-acetylglucosamine pyrophosphorylase/glucosamine-1-phosphate N-acetyltransferase